MKTAALIIASLTALLIAAPSRGADNVTSNYFPGAVTVLATSTNAGDTGLSTNVAYIALPLTALDGVTTGNTADVRAVMHGIVQGYYAAYVAATNPASSRVTRAVRYNLAASASNVVETITHKLITERVGTLFELE